MRIYRTVSGVLALLLCGVTGAAAQDGGKAGITMGYPASIGILWHAGDRVAIRPEFSISGNNGALCRARSLIRSIRLGHRPCICTAA